MQTFVGYIACLISVLCFGSNFIPAKKYEAGDGVFFQYAMAAGIICVGAFVMVYQFQTGADGPHFYPLAMLGGVIWCCGNIMCVPIINRIGMGLGLLVWGSASLLTGWLSGTFGFFGMRTDASHLRDQGKYIDLALNVPGVIVALLSLVVALFVKPEPRPVSPYVPVDASGFPLSEHDEGAFVNDLTVQFSDNGEKELATNSKRTFEGFLYSVIAGSLFGINFNPPKIVQDTQIGASQEGLDYVFSHFTGIFITSSFFFISYCVIKQFYYNEKPFINPEIAAPAFLSGVLWAVAQTSWFVALTVLPISVCFPLIVLGPGFVGSMWGVFLFGEIKGIRNYLLLAGVFVVASVAALLIVMSQKSCGEKC